MSVCRSCGAQISWIRMKSGKMMPVNPQRISVSAVLPGSKDALTLVTSDGKILSGVPDPASDKFGFESHFATCPAAAAHRRRDK